MIRRGDLLLTASTGGGAPAMAAAVRAWLDQRFCPEWEDHLMALAEQRQALRAAGATPPEVMRALTARIQDAAWLDCPCTVNQHRSWTPCEFCMSSCMHLWNFIRDGVPIGANRDPTCMPYF